MQFRSLDQEDPLEEEMATNSSIFAWNIPWTEEPGRLQSKGLHRVWAHTQLSTHACNWAHITHNEHTRTTEHAHMQLSTHNTQRTHTHNWAHITHSKHTHTQLSTHNTQWTHTHTTEHTCMQLSTHNTQCTHTHNWAYMHVASFCFLHSQKVSEIEWFSSVCLQLIQRLKIQIHRVYPSQWDYKWLLSELMSFLRAECYEQKLDQAT